MTVRTQRLPAWTIAGPVLALGAGAPLGAVLPSWSSGLVSIGLTVPIQSAVAWWTDRPVALGESPGSAILLATWLFQIIAT